MVDIERAILAKLKQSSDVLTSLGDGTNIRVYPSQDKFADKTYPLAIYHSDITPQVCFDGPAGIENSNYRLAVVATTYAEAKSIAFLLATTLHEQSGVWGGVTVQLMRLPDNGIADDTWTDPDTGKLYYIKDMVFNVIYSA